MKKLIDLFLVSDYDGFEFLIVSLDNKQWKFEANSIDERNDWVSAIEQQILTSLQVTAVFVCPERVNEIEYLTVIC